MNSKHRAYALTEMLVIIVIVAVLMALSVRPFRIMISEIPRSAGACRTLNNTTKALYQLKNDVELAHQITRLKGGILRLEQNNGPVVYTFTNGQITRRPGMNGSGTEYIWQLPNLKTESKLWSFNDRAYAVELTTWNQQTVLGREDARFKQTTVFFKKGQQR